MASRRMIALGGGSGTASFPLLATDGSTTNTSYSFASDATAGLFRVGANEVQLQSGNNQAQLDIAANLVRLKLGGTITHYLDINQYSIGVNGAYKWSSTGNASSGQDTGLYRLGAGSISVGNATGGDFSGSLTLASITQQTPNGAQWISGQNSELLTLSTVGTTTDTVGNLLPANSLIESVVARVTTTITTATSWALGDGTTAARFAAANSTMTAGATSVGTAHWAGTISSVQAAAAKVRVTTVGTPGAGVVRITVFYSQLVAPTS